ncbi:MAG: YitT family protein [Eubacteriales bacterium]|nr:YitT family protein [Eubacteriales bacterium]
MHLRMWIKRVILLLTGLTIAHLGVTLFLLADLGSDPFNVLIQGLFRFFPWPGFMTHGYVHMGVSFGIILVLLAVDRSYIRIGTLLCMILGGPIIDGFTALLGGIVNANLPMLTRLAVLVAGCVILAFGMTIVICSKAGTGPNDLVAVVISDKTRWKFGAVRIGVDVCFALAGFLLGGTLGLGTIICAFLVGPAAQIFMPLSEKLCTSIAG